MPANIVFYSLFRPCSFSQSRSFKPFPRRPRTGPPHGRGRREQEPRPSASAKQRKPAARPRPKERPAAPRRRPSRSAAPDGPGKTRRPIPTRPSAPGDAPGRIRPPAVTETIQPKPKKSKKLAAPDAHKYDPAGACPAWVSPDGRFSHAAVAALSSPDDFINTLSA